MTGARGWPCEGKTMTASPYSIRPGTAADAAEMVEAMVSSGRRPHGTHDPKSIISARTSLPFRRLTTLL